MLDTVHIQRPTCFDVLSKFNSWGITIKESDDYHQNLEQLNQLSNKFFKNYFEQKVESSNFIFEKHTSSLLISDILALGLNSKYHYLLIIILFSILYLLPNDALPESKLYETCSVYALSFTIKIYTEFLYFTYNIIFQYYLFGTLRIKIRRLISELFFLVLDIFIYGYTIVLLEKSMYFAKIIFIVIVHKFTLLKFHYY